MIPDRYAAPHAREIFDDKFKIELWTRYTLEYAKADVRATVQEGPERDLRLAGLITSITAPTPEAVRTREQDTGHDVVAFLSLIQQQVPKSLERHIHYGLTSSDLVDNAHFMMMWNHAHQMDRWIRTLIRELSGWENMSTIRAGRTHGQIADITSWGHQMHVQWRVFSNILADLCAVYEHTILKSAGPTGKSPLIGFRDHTVGAELHAEVVPSTQVIPRDYQLRWACVYLRLACAMENLALQVRLGARSEVGEVREGAVRIGSSAMPHKRNPIDSEKVCGLARVARGHFTALMEGGALWEDRDLSNSSLERIAVPGLAATVEHMILTMSKVMNELDVDYERMRLNARDPHTMSNILQSLAQKHFGFGPVKAGIFVRKHVYFDTEDGQAYTQHMGDFNVEDSERAVAWMDEATAIWRGLFG